MRLVPIALAAAGLTALAGPAGAVTFPVCTARLAGAAAGQATYCDTSPGGPTTSSGGWVRTVTVTVAAGAVTGDLDCVRSWVRTFAASAGEVVTFQMWDAGTCRLNLAAAAGGTTAVATSTTQYRVSPY